MITSIAITSEEHRARCDALLERVRADGLSGVVLFDPYYVLYYAGFAFAPTERPIAFILSASSVESATRTPCSSPRTASRSSPTTRATSRA